MGFVETIVERLAGEGDPRTRDWWERYLKGAVPFHGVPMAGIRSTVRSAQAEHRLPTEDLRRAAYELMEGRYAEEKLAGILVLQELVLPAGGFDPLRDLPDVAGLFDRGHIADWNTCDWLCVRVLGPVTRQGGEPTARTIAGWVDAPVLWRRRAAAVAFVDLAGTGDALFPGFVDLLLDTCDHLAADSERFAQTGVGWVLRELSDTEPDRVVAFVDERRSRLSREAVRMAAARLPDEHRERWGIRGARRRR